MKEPIDAAFVRRQLKDWDEQYTDWREEAHHCYDVVAGDQWDEADKAAMKEANRPAVSLNLVASFVRGICGLEVGNRQEARYLPREMGDVQVNELLNAAAAWVRDECGADDEESEAFRDLVICGIGACEVRICYAEDPAGKILIERIDPLSLRWDPAARKRGLTDARWVAYSKRLPRSEIERMFPDADLPMEAEGEYDEMDPAGEPHDREAARWYEGGTGGRDSTKGLLVWQYQYWEDEAFVRISGPNGQNMDLPKERAAQLGDKLAIMGLQAKPMNRRVYRQAFTAGGVVLEDRELPVEGFTISAMTGFRDRNKGYWYGFVRDVIEPQRYVNKMYSLGIDILANDAKGGLLAEEDAFLNRRQAEEDWSNPRKIIWMRPGGIAKVQPRQAGALPAALQRIFEATLELFPRISGVSVEFLGTADRAQAGILEHHRKQSTITTLQELFSSLTLYRRLSGAVVAKFIVKFLNDGRLVRLVGKDQERYVPLLMAPNTLDFDVIVDEAPSSSDVKSRTFAVLEQLLPMAVQAGVPIPPSIVDYMPLPSSLAQEWKQQLSQPQIPPEVQMQMEQGKAIIMQQQSEIQRMKQDQSAKMAELNAKWQQGMAELNLKSQTAEREAQLKREMATIDSQLEAEKAAAQIILERERWLAEWQLKAAEASAKADLEAMKMAADQAKQETEAMRSRAEAEIAEMAKSLKNVVQLRPQAGARRKRSITVERDKAGRLLGALIEMDEGEGPRRERVALKRGNNGRISGADIESLD
jgi:hypothetical protein